MLFQIKKQLDSRKCVNISTHFSINFLVFNLEVTWTCIKFIQCSINVSSSPWNNGAENQNHITVVYNVHLLRIRSFLLEMIWNLLPQNKWLARLNYEVVFSFKIKNSVFVSFLTKVFGCNCLEALLVLIQNHTDDILFVIFQYKVTASTDFVMSTYTLDNTRTRIRILELGRTEYQGMA